MSNVHKAGFASPRTPKPTKRNLSISPSQNDKKTQNLRFTKSLRPTLHTNDIAPTSYALDQPQGCSCEPFSHLTRHGTSSYTYPHQEYHQLLCLQ